MRRAIILVLLGLATASSAFAQHNERYDAAFRRYSKRYFGVGFDWRYFKAQAMAESDLEPGAKSPVGARGLMQLMPSTFKMIQTAKPTFGSIDDPEWNIAAGILHDRDLWTMWERTVPELERPNFMFGAYNAGEGPITRAVAAARAQQLEHTRWPTIELIAPTIPRWRYRETIGYVHKIGLNYDFLKNVK
jgi:soluble lytic murein transglycosylase-like protein